MTYKEIIIQAMLELSNKSDTIFIGQGVGHNVGGTFMSATLNSVPEAKKLEFPVAEQFQMQFSTGVSIAGQCPISIFPRQNFLLYGLADLVNFTDKIEALSKGSFHPKMIIRTALGTIKKIFPGIQHSDTFIEGFRSLLKNTLIFDLTDKNMIEEAYQKAYNHQGCSMLVEYGDLYNE